MIFICFCLFVLVEIVVQKQKRIKENPEKIFPLQISDPQNKTWYFLYICFQTFNEILHILKELVILEKYFK